MIGRYRLPLYLKKFSPNLLFIQPLPYNAKYMLYLRICLENDVILDTSDNVLVEVIIIILIIIK